MASKKKLSENMFAAAQVAREMTLSEGASHIFSEYFLLAILGQPTIEVDGVNAAGGEFGAGKLLRQLGVEVSAFRKDVEKVVNSTEYPASSSEYSPEGQDAKLTYLDYSMLCRGDMAKAIAMSRDLGHEVTRTEHLLLAILARVEQTAQAPQASDGLGVRTTNLLAVLFRKHNITLESVRAAVIRTLGAATITADAASTEENHIAAGATVNTAAAEAPKGKTPAIEHFCRDLTAMARAGKLDPVIGRDIEVERCVEILGRRRKNNPVLLGEPGVGKTAVVEGLAQVIAEGMCPKYLANTRILSLDMASVVAGTKYRGQLEERVKTLISEVSRDPDIVLFIDELHTVIGGGAAEGTMDIANMLKPALGRGEMRCVAATTTDEYRKYVEKDGGLERRFQTVMINPPSLKDTFLVLQGLRPRYEQHHGVQYSDEALQLIVSLADRYISDRFFPDKAIDVMDEVGARVKTMHNVEPGKYERASIEEKISNLRQSEAKAARDRNYDLAKSIQHDMDVLRTQVELMEPGNGVSVTTEDITFVVSRASGVPVSQVSEAEAARLLKMEETMSEGIVGQTEAVRAVSQAVRRSRAGLRPDKMPIGSFLFVGPTGVGKTEVARKLAEYMFGDAGAMVRLDMSEYQEQHSIAKLMGAPPGYVGHEEEGVLTKAVRRKPYTVVLLDEIEKAHSDVYNMLLQILDDGRLTDSKGRTVNFKNTVIIMTSNVGAQTAIVESMGFKTAGSSSEPDGTRAKGIYAAKLKEKFPPEFLNRIDETVIFESLNQENLRAIARLMLADLVKRASGQNIALTVTDRGLDFLVDKGFSKTMGARPLSRTIMMHVENPMSEAMLRGDIQKGSRIVADLDESGEKFSFSIEAVTVEAEPLKVVLR